jgi:hypothetical protein
VHYLSSPCTLSSLVVHSLSRLCTSIHPLRLLSAFIPSVHHVHLDPSIAPLYLLRYSTADPLNSLLTFRANPHRPRRTLRPTDRNKPVLCPTFLSIMMLRRSQLPGNPRARTRAGIRSPHTQLIQRLHSELQLSFQYILFTISFLRLQEPICY